MNAISIQPLSIATANPRGEQAVHALPEQRWVRPAETQHVYSVAGSDNVLIRAAMRGFAKASTRQKLWMTAAVPVLVAALVATPALIAAAAIRGSVPADVPGTGTVLYWTAFMNNAAFAGILVGALLSWMVAAVLCREALTVVTDVIASAYDLLEGDVDVAIPHRNRVDEYGQVARAFEALRVKAKDMRQLEDERLTIADAREEERTRLVTTFERSLGDIVTSVASAASQLHSTAGVLAAGTEQTREQTDVVSRAIEETASSTTAAAAASDEFAMSIGEISRQAGSSADLARRAREAATDADEKISQLSSAAGEIGQIVGLIQSIAQRTNLLALNASIEAARGGEAGRGFAVVASEVKELAAQTSRATERVAQQIAAIQDSTGQSVRALQSIGDQVKELELTAISIASAVDQQSVAGQDLARSLDMAARATDDVSDNIMQVRDATRNTGVAASQVLQSADELERQAGTLRSKATDLVQQFRSGAHLDGARRM